MRQLLVLNWKPQYSTVAAHDDIMGLFCCANNGRDEKFISDSLNTRRKRKAY